MAVLYIYPLCAGEVRQYTSPEIVERMISNGKRIYWNDKSRTS